MSRFSKFLRLLFKVCVVAALFVPASFSDESKVKGFIDSVAKEIIEAVNNKNSSEKKIRSDLEQVIVQNFDITWMAQFASGIAYRSLSEAEVSEYTAAYSNYLVSSYLPILSKYSKETYSINKITTSNNKTFDVDVVILRNNGKPPLLVSYRVIRKDDGSFKARDMIVEGVSTILNQRSEFSNTIQSKGMSYLIKQLKSSNKSTKSY